MRISTFQPKQKLNQSFNKPLLKTVGRNTCEYLQFMNYFIFNNENSRKTKLETKTQTVHSCSVYLYDIQEILIQLSTMNGKTYASFTCNIIAKCFDNDLLHTLIEKIYTILFIFQFLIHDLLNWNNINCIQNLK